MRENNATVATATPSCGAMMARRGISHEDQRGLYYCNIKKLGGTVLANGAVDEARIVTDPYHINAVRNNMESFTQ